MSTLTQRRRFQDPILVVGDEGKPPLLVVRGTSDGSAAEVVIDTPSVRMTIRVPEIAEAC